ncbi:MAG: ABC transporter ATP-binding protein [Patescibacteria group bacterium]|nr:ABC transporter ATP-binding protein [Patescibacteria group bacterium]
MLIEVKNLVKEYRNEDVITSVLRGLNFEIKKGEFVSIMGPSGSGKSTLMHILGLLDRPTSGVYKFDGRNTENLDDNELAMMRNEKIGFVFQAFNLLPRTNVLENVKLPLLYSKKKIDAETRAKKVLESVGLGHRLEYFTNQISGGEKQRVAIARALVNEPEIIFADEPTGNLDSKSGIQVMEIFQKLNDAGHTIILVTHETATAEYADRIIKIRDGEIVGDEKVHNKRRGDGNGQLK